MKNLLIATLPALALLALGGCATSGALTSTTESDGVYYSSADKTTSNGSLNSVYSNRGYGQSQSVAGSANPDGFAYNRATDVTGTATPAATTDDANPDYVAGTGATTEGYNTSTLGGSSDYYANSLNTSGSGFGVPYTGPGVSSYNYSPAVSTYSSFYGSPFGYGAGLGYGYGGFGGFGSPYYGGLYSPYAYSGFYDPFYSSFYSPFYSPFGYGYGSGLSIGFGLGFGGFGYGGYGYPFGGYYGGYSPYYGGGYGGYGYRSYGSAAPGVYGERGNSVLVGPRGSRGGMVLNAQPNGVVGAGGASAPVNVGAGRRGGGMIMGANGLAAPTMSSMGQPNGSRGAFSNGATSQPSVAAPSGVPAGGGRRGGFFSGFFGNGANGGGQRAQMAQPQSNGGYAPQSRQYNNQSGRSFSQPSRSFSQPSFSQPSRSFSQPSGGFGGGGGGGFGGGGGGGGGRRGGR